MRNFSALLFLAVVLVCLPVGVKADSLTVAEEGAATNKDVPVNVFEVVHNYELTQILYLADELSDIQSGGTISAIKFYATNNITWNYGNVTPVFEVRILETTITALTEKVTMPVNYVYRGQPEKDVDYLLFEFPTPYEYTDASKNLVIEIKVAEVGTQQDDQSALFYGKTTGATNRYYHVGTNEVSSTGTFLPKTTFTYLPGGCYAPQNVTLSEPLPDGAIFTWEQRTHETTYQWACVKKDIEVTSWNTLEANVRTVTVNNLYADTAYDFYVRSYCGGEEYSESVKVPFTPVCPAPTFPETPVTNITATSATITWNAAEGITQYEYAFDSYPYLPNFVGVEPKEGLSAQLTNLEPLTTYNFSVRSYYSDKSWSETITTTFKTTADCDIITVDAEHPWTENFNNQESNAMPACWAAAGNVEAVYVTAYGSLPDLDGKRLYFAGTSADYAYAILPDFATPLNTLQIAFAHVEGISSKRGKIEVGYYKDETFTSLKAYDNNDDWEWRSEEAYPLTAVPAGAKLAFGYKPKEGGFPAAVDNIVVSLNTETPTALSATPDDAGEKAVKRIENNQLIIIRNGVKYNALGTMIK